MVRVLVLAAFDLLRDDGTHVLDHDAVSNPVCDKMTLKLGDLNSIGLSLMFTDVYDSGKYFHPRFPKQIIQKLASHLAQEINQEIIEHKIVRVDRLCVQFCMQCLFHLHNLICGDFWGNILFPFGCLVSSSVELDDPVNCMFELWR